MSPVLRAVATALMLVFAHAALAQSADTTEAESPEQPGFEVAGISASGGEDDPRVLYILPWQASSLPRRPRAELNREAPELDQPLSTRTLESHRQFRQTLNPLVLQPLTAAPGQTQP